MTLHAFTEYIKYRLNAKTRHGVHSPFVYALIEKVLKDKSDTPLQNKLTAFLNTQQIMVLNNTSPAAWKDAVRNIQNGETVLIIPAIHKAKLNTAYWNELVADEHVKLSIDLYKTGLLFFKDDFKEKQHFILKYPA